MVQEFHQQYAPPLQGDYTYELKPTFNSVDLPDGSASHFSANQNNTKHSFYVSIWYFIQKNSEQWPGNTSIFERYDVSLNYLVPESLKAEKAHSRFFWMREHLFSRKPSEISYSYSSQIRVLMQIVPHL